MLLLEGKPIKEKIENAVLSEVHQMRKKNIIPHLGVILVGNREDSEIYVALKKKKAHELGMDFSLYRFSEDESEQAVIDAIKFLNNDENIHGIIVQLPLPDNFNTENIIDSISDIKDVDDLKNTNTYLAPSPHAIIEILDHYSIELKDQKIIILGRGRLIGKPLEKLLLDRHLDVSAVDTDTDGLIEKIKKADILIAATGTGGIVTEELVKIGSTVISVGDEVNFDRVKDYVEALTPQKGGVGPITVALLLQNVILAAKKQTS